MSKPIGVKSTMLFCADLETCTPNTKYFERTQDTFVYAFKLVRVPIQWHASVKDVGENKGIPLSYTNWNKHPSLANLCFGSIQQFINGVLTKLQPHPTTTTIIYFHNGQKFDFWFFLKPLVELGGHLILDDLKKDGGKKGEHYFVFGDTEGWLSLKLYFGIGNNGSKIEFRDSIKLQNSSIASISKNLFGEKGVYKTDVANNEWFKDLDLTKHLEFNPDYVQDLTHYAFGDVITCQDGLTYARNNYQAGPQTIKQRVESDVYIMVAMLYYYLLNHVINLPGDDRIPATTGSLAIMSYVNQYLKQHEGLKIQMGENPKEADKMLGDNVYECNNEYRVNIRNALLGNDFLPSIVRGGYCNVLDSDKNKILKGEFISLDVNSEYPFVATQPLPYGQHESVNHIPKDGGYVCGYHVKKIKQLLTNAPAMLPAKGQSNANDSTHYLFKVNDCIIVLTKEEKEQVFGNPRWFQIEEPQLLQVGRGNAKPYVKDYMVTNYEAKLKASEINNSSLKTSAKLKLNALTGKFIQNFVKATRFYPKYTSLEAILKYIEANLNDELSQETKTEITNLFKNKEKIIVNLVTPNNFAYAPTYCAITGKGRAWIQSHILTLAENFPKIKVMYSDTDSIKIWCKTKQQYNEVMNFVKEGLNDNELGKFKEEFKNEIKYANFICPKKYLCATTNQLINISKCALSGLSGHDVIKQLGTNEINIHQIKLGDKFIVLRPKKVPSGVVLLNSEYILKM